ncbi:hypothetical protein B0H14DRAFT_3456456 [Mycena olivaceomarginata]|nr:hypothetical protein B0H14DRAFT_3456456 [Mycena olivaceomarginata]
MASTRYLAGAMTPSASRHSSACPCRAPPRRLRLDNRRLAASILPPVSHDSVAARRDGPRVHPALILAAAPSLLELTLHLEPCADGSTPTTSNGTQRVEWLYPPSVFPRASTPCASATATTRSSAPDTLAFRLSWPKALGVAMPRGEMHSAPEHGRE